MWIIGSSKKSEHTHCSQTQTKNTNNVMWGRGADSHGGETKLRLNIKQEVMRTMRKNQDSHHLLSLSPQPRDISSAFMCRVRTRSTRCDLSPRPWPHRWCPRPSGPCWSSRKRPELLDSSSTWMPEPPAQQGALFLQKEQTQIMTFLKSWRDGEIGKDRKVIFFVFICL